MSDEGSTDVAIHGRAEGQDGQTFTMKLSAALNTRSVLSEINGEKVG